MIGCKYLEVFIRLESGLAFGLLTKLPRHQSHLSLMASLYDYFNNTLRDFPGGTVIKNLPANVGNTGPSPGPGRSHMPQSN